MVRLGKILPAALRRRRVEAEADDDSLLRRVERANRASAADRRPAEDRMPAQAIDQAQGWARPEYGRYMATSPSVYSAVKLRSDAITRPPLLVYRGGSSDSPRLRTRVEQSHPVVRLLERVNPWYTRGDLWRATEIYLCLWGAAFWAIERGPDGEPELWPLCAPTAWW